MSRSRGNKTGVQKKSDHESGFFEEENQGNSHSSSSQGRSTSTAPIVKKKKGRPPKKKMMVHQQNGHSAVVRKETLQITPPIVKMNLRNSNRNNNNRQYMSYQSLKPTKTMIQIKKVYDTKVQEIVPEYESEDEYQISQISVTTTSQDPPQSDDILECEEEKEESESEFSVQIVESSNDTSINEDTNGHTEENPGNLESEEEEGEEEEEEEDDDVIMEQSNESTPTRPKKTEKSDSVIITGSYTQTQYDLELEEVSRIKTKGK
jgi:hypothetical protein